MLRHVAAGALFFRLIAALFCTTALASEPVLKPQEISPGVYVLPSSYRTANANIGWVEFRDHIVLIGAPHPVLVAKCLAEIAARTRKPVQSALLTHVRAGEIDSVRLLAARGIRILAPTEAVRLLRAGLAAQANGGDAAAPRFEAFINHLELQDAGRHLDIRAYGQAAGPADAAVYVREGRTLFSGELCANGPHADLTRSNSRAWVKILEALQRLPIRTVVPGFGTVGGPQILDRQKRFLRELRRQVAYSIVCGHSLADAKTDVRMLPEWLVWRPYDNPTEADIAHIYRELTAPYAPYGGRPFSPQDRRPKALALIGDRVHEPGAIEPGLSKAFEKAGIDARFLYDYRALTAENLKPVRLLVILRDGMVWPVGREKEGVVWMTPEQEQAVSDFVRRGGGLLVLHNALALYPPHGLYEQLTGGVYKGHGPLEAFRVKVVKPQHPIARGVPSFVVADEQHTPAVDPRQVNIFLESRSEEGVVAPAGWTKEVGKGRVAYLANGHTREALAHPIFQTLMQNAMRWCLHLDTSGKSGGYSTARRVPK
jgi:type 1 glutamine amidotransferase